jgi:hypothetical protein
MLELGDGDCYTILTALNSWCLQAHQEGKPEIVYKKAT